MNINEYLVDLLEKLGVEYAFGGSGQVNASLMIALKNSSIQTVIVKNEQAASFMACGYAMFSGKLGVCFATGGPGAFNVMSGLGVALSDSLPVLAITGYEAEDLIGKGALAETSGLNRTPDSMAMFEATTKANFMIESPDQTCNVFEKAIKAAFEGRPGPVHVHVPIDLTTAEVTNFREIDIAVEEVMPKAEQVAAYADALAEAIKAGEEIMLLVGYGAVRSGAQDELMTLAERYQIPYATTMDGKGALPEDHALSLGVFGTAGDPRANDYFFEKATFVVAVGNSFAHNATWKFSEELYAGKRLMHINIDRNELNKVYRADFPMISDAKPAISGLLKALEGKVEPVAEKKVVEGEKWTDKAIERGDKMHPADLVMRLSDLLPPETIILGDAGGHMLWLSAYLTLKDGQLYQNPGSFGPMASHVNGAIGMKCAHPDRTIISACGDGSYLMAGFELLTAVQEDIPVIWVIFNNGAFNVIRHFLNNMFGEAPFMTFQNPDYVKYAEACGATGFRVTTPDEFEEAFKKALELNAPVLIDAVLDPEPFPPFRGGSI
jgi:acetolactate synthase-1/2/3 large subunit